MEVDDAERVEWLVWAFWGAYPEVTIEIHCNCCESNRTADAKQRQTKKSLKIWLSSAQAVNTGCEHFILKQLIFDVPFQNPFGS